MAAAVRSIANIDELEAAEAKRPEPFTDIVMLGIPMPTYKALSDAAARRNMTVAELMSLAFNTVLEG